MKQLIIATLLLIAACITFSTVSYQMKAIAAKDMRNKLQEKYNLKEGK